MAATPTSQQPADRPLTFILDDEVSGLGPTQPVTLYVRPTDLTRQDPSRINVVQTLNGGAWADDFGPGVAMITIAGNTGWRKAGANGDDGETRFKLLREQVFDQWHLRRAQAIASSKNPDDVKLIFSDSLDSYVATVAPMSFVLRRSRSQPLLMQYQIQMLMLADGVGNLAGPAAARPTAPLSALSKAAAAIASLKSSLDKIIAFANNAKNFIERSILGPVKGFLDTTQSIFNKVMETFGAIRGVVTSLVSVATSIAHAGSNIFRTLAAVSNIPLFVKNELMRVSAAYANIFCLMSNSLQAPDEFQDYSTLYGSSNCSSTSGGRPLSTFESSNTLEAVVPPPAKPAVSVSSTAQASLIAMSTADVPLAPPSTATVGVHAGAIAAGVAFA